MTYSDSQPTWEPHHDFPCSTNHSASLTHLTVIDVIVVLFIHIMMRFLSIAVKMVDIFTLANVCLSVCQGIMDGPKKGRVRIENSRPFAKGSRSS